MEVTPATIRLRRNEPFHGLVQVAGVHDLAEASMLAEMGFHSIGFPLRLPVNHEDCTEAEAEAMATAIRPLATPVCICYLDTADSILNLCGQLGMHHVQLHGPIRLSELERLRRVAPDLYVIKSLVVQADGSNAEMLVDTTLELAPVVDAFITDTHNPVTGADGATGMTHDWSISSRIAELSPRPVILAGGLTPENVAEAIYAVRPAGVDVHSGLEGSDGRKERNRALRFLSESLKAFTRLSAISL